MVPHLTTALSGPLKALEQQIIGAMPAIERWFRNKWSEHTVPFYSSVDLRNSGFKIAPVDTNLFPGGFNNLNPEFLPLCVQAAQSAVQKVCPNTQGFLLVPENHTRNMFYLQNVARLAQILRRAGLAVRIGTLLPEISEPTRLELPSGEALTLEPIRRQGNRVLLDAVNGKESFNPCAVLLNNDLSAGVPEILQGLEQTVLPPLEAGWATRRKSAHFAHYDAVAKEFSELIGIDPWLINPYFARCGQVNFAEETGLECLAAQLEMLMPRVATKYKEYGIKEKPFFIVKADAGTYGMGIMTVKSVDDVRGLNRKTRTKMSVIKEGQQVSEVMIQEGVYTFESVNEAVAEPVVYMIDQFVVGGFYRVHTTRGKDENLNSPGMHFVPLAFEGDCQTPDQDCGPDELPNRFYTYGVIARLAMLAAALELEEMAQTA
jgi:glutamate--cysteine ligase